MRNKSILLFVGILALSAVFVGCGGGTNVNVNVRNANANANRATPTAAPTFDRSNTNVGRTDYDKNRAEYEKDRGTSTIGQGANDSWIWFKTRAALATTADLRDSTINVDVVNDKITLKGTVGTAAQKASAETVAKGIEGQKGVTNNLTVSAGDSLTNRAINGNTRTNSNR